MQRIWLCLICMSIVVVMTGCSIFSSSEMSGNKEGKNVEDSYRYTFKTEDQLFEYIGGEYSATQIIERLFPFKSDFFEETGIPDSLLFVDELLSQGYYEEVKELISMADKIGYYPGIVFGNYVADGNKVIHYTRGECFDRIPIEELMIIGPFSSVDAVNNEINDGDTYLNGYTMCLVCCN